jgi:hypothetical protein
VQLIGRSNARCINAAQLQARGLLFTSVRSGPAASGDAKAVGSGATRPYATTRARARAREAVTFCILSSNTWNL